MDLSSLLPTIFDALHCGLLIIDREGVIKVYNKAAARIFSDNNRYDIIGKYIQDFRPEAWLEISDILKTGCPQIGKKIVLSQITIIANRTPLIVNEEIIGVVSVFQDISEYEAIISDLKSYKEMHRELEAIFESSCDGLYITDGDANTIRVNSAYERITGLSRKNLIGYNMRELIEQHIFDHSVTIEVLKKKEHISIIQKIKDDKQVVVTGTPIFDDKNDIVLVVTNVRDITELNQLRDKLAKSLLISSRYRDYLKENNEIEHILQETVVKSQASVQVVRKAIKVAKVDSHVLLLGESGVGKSMMARIIHQMSPRKDYPFIKINCAAIPEALMESELFGFEKGSFTGARTNGKAGLIEAGHCGTVFFDEISELKLDMQAKLLDVIEEKVFTKIGSTSSTHVDVNIVAATNKNLKEMIAQGKFRKDLYYRLNVVPITIPPLRERVEDIPILVSNILAKFTREKKLTKHLDPKVLERIMQYDFPGNIRELLNMMENMIIMSESEQINLEDLPVELKSSISTGHEIFAGDTSSLKDMMGNFEVQIIKKALQLNGDILNASKSLKIHHSTLWRKMNRYGIKLTHVNRE